MAENAHNLVAITAFCCYNVVNGIAARDFEGNEIYQGLVRVLPEGELPSDVEVNEIVVGLHGELRVVRCTANGQFTTELATNQNIFWWATVLQTRAWSKHTTIVAPQNVTHYALAGPALGGCVPNEVVDEKQEEVSDEQGDAGSLWDKYVLPSGQTVGDLRKRLREGDEALHHEGDEAPHDKGDEARRERKKRYFT